MTPPRRDFPVAEFERRLERSQRLMRQAGLGALLLTTEPELRWFTGFLTQFWQSPTRPWFLVVPAQGKPVAVIPGIGAECMRRTWIEDIRTWPSPDPADDGGQPADRDAGRGQGGGAGRPADGARDPPAHAAWGFRQAQGGRNIFRTPRR